MVVRTTAEVECTRFYKGRKYRQIDAETSDIPRLPQLFQQITFCDVSEIL
jgi:hypothetical protein